MDVKRIYHLSDVWIAIFVAYFLIFKNFYFSKETIGYLETKLTMYIIITPLIMTPVCLWIDSMLKVRAFNPKDKRYEKQ